MPSRVSRRRAIARGLPLLAGFTLATVWRADLAMTQTLDPPSDTPGSPEPAAHPPAVSLPPAEEAATAVPVDQVGDGTQPADQPAPPMAGSGSLGVPPVKLMIPALGVEAAVEAVGDAEDGTMATPTHPDDVAWYEPGVGMGVPGNAVFAAHVNWDGRLRPFGLLHKLEIGDAIQVIDERGRGYEYVVNASDWVRAEGAPLDAIFEQTAEPIVTLITCGGEFVASRREYLDRLIVKAKGAPTS